MELIQSIKDRKTQIRGVQDIKQIIKMVFNKLSSNTEIRNKLKDLFTKLDDKNALDALMAFVEKLDPSKTASNEALKTTKDLIHKFQTDMEKETNTNSAKVDTKQ